jgi:hypothetical protein
MEHYYSIEKLVGGDDSILPFNLYHVVSFYFFLSIINELLSPPL